MKQDRQFYCTIEAAMCFIGGKYKPIILWNLIDNTLRFSDLRKRIPQATPKMLTQQLRELESDGLINRVVYPIVPPRTEYSLTELGETLIPIIEAIRNWGVYYFEYKGLPNPCK